MLFLFYSFSCIKNETSMGPGGRVPNYGSSVIALCVLFPCRVVILRKDNLTWYTQDALFLARRLFPRIHLALVACIRSGTAKNSLGSVLKDLSFIMALTRRFVSRYPRGTD